MINYDLLLVLIFILSLLGFKFYTLFNGTLQKLGLALIFVAGIFLTWIMLAGCLQKSRETVNTYEVLKQFADGPSKKVVLLDEAGKVQSVPEESLGVVIPDDSANYRVNVRRIRVSGLGILFDKKIVEVKLQSTR